MTQPATLDDWIARESTAFSVDSPESIDRAVDQIVAALGNRIELLGFGEALHGSEETLLLRNRMFERLVAAHGYSAIAVESSFPRGRLVNDYVAGHGAESFQAVAERGFSHGFGRLDANRELVEWIRSYNSDPSRRVQVQFYGFDSPTEMMYSDSPRQLLSLALDYLGSIDGASSQERRERIEPLLGLDSDWENPAAAMDPTKSIGLSPAATALRTETEDLLTELAIRRPELVAKSDQSQYLEAVHHAALARQLLGYHAGVARTSKNRVAELLGMRDAMMADNLAYIVSRERGRGKVLAFAHNSHLKVGRAQWQLGPQLLQWWPAGAHLREMFAGRYAVVGSAVGVSEENGIGSPEAGTLEARLMAAPGPARFLPTPKGQALVSAVEGQTTRSGSHRNPTYFPLTPQSLAEFDGLIALDRTTYNRGGPSLG